MGDLILKGLSLPSLLLNFSIEEFYIKDDELTAIEKISILLKNKLVISILLIIFLIVFLILPIELFLIVFVSVFLSIFIIIFLPKFNNYHKYDDINSELPYALRHIATELKSGKGLHDSISTIANSDYGSLSLEFKRVLEEIKYGESSENALVSMSKRVNSEGLTRAIHQIISTLRIGGNLANNLTIIADDIHFDMQIKLKEYTQKLNGFILIYTFLAILIPVVVLIMLMAASTVMGDIIPGTVIYIMYILLFPMVVVVLGVLIKSLEPKV